MDREEAAEILQEAKEAIEEALEEARTALCEVQEAFYFDQADAYWLSHIESALDGDGPAPTMQSTINGLRRA